MIYFCCEEKRRSAVRAYQPPTSGASAGQDINGIDYLEVVDREAPNPNERQRLLRIYFVKDLASPLLENLQSSTTANIRFAGGERTIGIVADQSPTLVDGHLEVHVNQRGDFSTYTLALVDSKTSKPLGGLDPALASVDFSFKVECPTPFDCRTQTVCTTPAADVPEIDYLAKDYVSFRQLILDRIALLLPDWVEHNPADLGIVLVELLAYLGDQLSYYQDAVATEAYLGTARQRVSVRRHARLLDYAMHDGCNSRVWVQVALKSGAPATGVRLPIFLVKDSGGNWIEAESEPVPSEEMEVRRTRFATKVTDETLISEADFSKLVDQYAPEIFEPMQAVILYSEHNEIPFYTWSDDSCCLPKGATKATLAKHCPNLKAGDVLIFKEVYGPETGEPGDADLTHRHAVRLTNVAAFEITKDNAGNEIKSPLGDPITGQSVTEIEWATGDALPFALCLSSTLDGGDHQHDVSIALGNIVLADHGMTSLEAEALGSVPASNPVLALVSAAGCSHCEDCEPQSTPPRFRPRLADAPLTQAATFDSAGTAASAFVWEREDVLPAIQLGDEREELWLPRSDLLSSDSFAPEFVAEVENDSHAATRFGDDGNGMRPAEKTSFFASYRVGNGTSGNIGAEAIAHLAGETLLTSGGWIDSVTNPLPAAGGDDPETLEEVRQYAPQAFRTQKRAVTPEDYATVAKKHAEVQRAAATLRWTGSWHTVFLTIDRVDGGEIDAAFENELRQFLEEYRMAGQDLEIDGPSYVALELEMMVCVESDYFRSDVLAALQDVFSSGTRLDGSLGFFHPDNFTFEQSVYLSQIYAAAQEVAGVRHVEINTLQRLGTPSTVALDEGVLTISRLEIARLDNDPNFPERGVLTFEMRGGR
jgi:hypothetical protein